MRFCQSFMTELYRHIGADTDVPAGDIGVGRREVVIFLGSIRGLSITLRVFLQVKVKLGGSLARPEATGYGTVYFIEEMLKARGDKIEGKTIAISGYGNVGTYFIEKANQLGARVVTIADEFGYVHDPEGIKGEKLELLMDLWCVHRRPARDYADEFGLRMVVGKSPWEVPCDIAVPTATQNELKKEDAKKLIANGCTCIAEAANMPCSAEAVELFLKIKFFLARQGSNAGGVSVSGLEMSQNSMRYSWSFEEVDAKLKDIMADIYRNPVKLLGNTAWKVTW